MSDSKVDLPYAKSGDPLAISAKTWNVLMDSAKAYQRGRHDLDVGPGGSGNRPCTVLIKNTALTDCPRFGILGINAFIFGADASTPAPEDSEFLNNAALAGGVPSSPDHNGRFAIALEPIAAGKIGLCCIGGCMICKIFMLDDRHKQADVTSGDFDHLTSGDIGSAWIVAGGGAPDMQWALIRFGSGLPTFPTPPVMSPGYFLRILDNDGNIGWVAP